VAAPVQKAGQEIGDKRFAMPETRLGIEISDSAVSVVCVKSGLKTSQVMAYSRQSLHGAGSGEDGAESALARSLDEVAALADVSRCACAASLAPSLVSFRNLAVPFTEARKIRQVLPFELEARLPRRAEDILADYHVVRKGQETECLAAAADRERVAETLALLAGAGQDPESLSVGGFTAALAHLAKSRSAGAGLFVYADNTAALVALHSNGALVTARSVALPETDRPAALAREALLTLHACTGPDAQPLLPESVVLAGPGMEGREDQDALSDRLNLPVIRLDMASEWELPVEPLPGTRWEPHLFDGALALAAYDPAKGEGFNLRQGPFAPKRRWQEYKQELGRAGALALVILLVLAARFFTVTHLMAKEASRMERDIAAQFAAVMPGAGKITDPVRQLEAEVKALRQTQSQSSPDTEPGGARVVDVLRAVSENIPPEVETRLNTFILSGEGVQLAGDTTDFQAVDQIKSGLSAVPYFVNVELVSTGKSPDGEAVRFKFKAGLKAGAGGPGAETKGAPVIMDAGSGTL
jgi:general secretion pathway protein L